MKSIGIIFQEHKKNLYMISRISMYDLKITYMANKLGFGWMVLNPLIQIFVYWIVFGLGIRGGTPVNGVSFFIWLICGLIPWFYIGPGITQGSNSIYSRLMTVSKMNFPLSIIPTISIVTQLYNHLVMMGILFVVISFSYGLSIISLLGVLYYMLATTCFLVSLAFITSTLSTLSRDIHLIIQSLIKMLFFLTPIMWTINKNTPKILKIIIDINPLYYIVEGYRSSLLWKNNSMILSVESIVFWSFTCVLFIIGAGLHLKFRKHFVDYL